MSERSGAAALLPRGTARSRLHRANRSPRPLRIADVAMFYGERGGGIRTYLEAKADFAARTQAFDHHLVIPGRVTSDVGAGRHEHRSLRLAASNGYRVPLGGSDLQATLRTLRPNVVLLHDPFWTPRLAARTAHETCALVIAVHHASAALQAAGIPGPHTLYAGALRRWYRRAYLHVDAVMSVVDPVHDTHRFSTLPLRLGLDPVFGPRIGIPRGDHVLYVGRLSREKGVGELLEAAARSHEPWPLALVGTGPAGDALRDRARQLGLLNRARFTPYIQDREELALAYAGACCVVLPGPHETFGLAALEAAACGTPVVTASDTPSSRLIGDLVETFTAGDSRALARAIERARRRSPDPGAGARIAARHSWDAELAAELEDLTRLLDLAETAR